MLQRKNFTLLSNLATKKNRLSNQFNYWQLLIKVFLYQNFCISSHILDYHLLTSHISTKFFMQRFFGVAIFMAVSIFVLPHLERKPIFLKHFIIY